MIAVENEDDGDTSCCGCTWNSPHKLEKETGEINWSNLDSSIVDIGQNNWKNLGELWWHFCHSDSSEKQLANAGEKIHQD